MNGATHIQYIPLHFMCIKSLIWITKMKIAIGQYLSILNTICMLQQYFLKPKQGNFFNQRGSTVCIYMCICQPRLLCNVKGSANMAFMKPLDTYLRLQTIHKTRIYKPCLHLSIYQWKLCEQKHIVVVGSYETTYSYTSVAQDHSCKAQSGAA